MYGVLSHFLSELPFRTAFQNFEFCGGLGDLNKVDFPIWLRHYTYSLEVVLHFSELSHYFDWICLACCFLKLRVLLVVSGLPQMPILTKFTSTLMKTLCCLCFS
jgi:hypothetical protein